MEYYIVSYVCPRDNREGINIFYTAPKLRFFFFFSTPLLLKNLIHRICHCTHLDPTLSIQKLSKGLDFSNVSASVCQCLMCLEKGLVHSQFGTSATAATVHIVFRLKQQIFFL